MNGSAVARPAPAAARLHAMLIAMRWCWLVLCASLLVCGCGPKRVAKHSVSPVRPGTAESGVASWYGYPYHGRPAANGEIYDMEQLTAAHRTLPFNTWVRVKNLSNGREVDVRITDRGPFVHGRCVDLSRRAAQEIDMLTAGITRVRLTVIRAPAPAAVTSARYAVQVAALRDKARAEQIRTRLAARYGEAHLVPRVAAVPLWRVLVGRFDTPEEAEALASELRSAGDDSFVTKLDAP